MKRILISIIMMLTFLPLIAFSYENVTIRCNVSSTIDPVFALMHMDVEGKSTRGISSVDLTKEDVEIEFRVVQLNMSRCSGRITLIISATPFTSDDFVSYKPEIVNVNLYDNGVPSTYLDQRFTLRYSDFKTIRESDVSSFYIRWMKDEQLYGKDYHTVVTFTCEID